MKSHVGPSIKLSAIVIRACDDCAGSRELGKPCAHCGNTKPATVRDLGVIAAKDRSWWDRMKWKCWGVYAAQRRIKKTNREMCDQSG